MHREHLVLTWCPTVVDIPTSTMFAFKAQGISQKRRQEEEPEDQDVCYETVSSIYPREAAPMKSQKYGYLNKTCTMSQCQHQLTCQSEWRLSQGPIHRWRAINAYREWETPYYVIFVSNIHQKFKVSFHVTWKHNKADDSCSLET